MRCEECQALVEEYFDGELSERAVKAVAVHVENCSSCRAALQQLTIEQQAYQGYDRGLEVSPDLWARVRDQLAAENNRQPLALVPRGIRPVIRPAPRPSRRWEQQVWGRGRLVTEFSKLLSFRFSLAASVAMVLFAVLVTVALMKYLNKPEPPPAQVALSSETPRGDQRLPAETSGAHDPLKSTGVEGRSDEPEKTKMAGEKPLPVRGGASMTAARQSREGRRPLPGTPEQLVREAEKKYLSAIALLTRDAVQRPSQLDPETRVKLDGALAAIDRTIVSTRRAVRRNPNDPLAVQYMLAAYGKKVDVLKEMSNY